MTLSRRMATPMVNRPLAFWVVLLVGWLWAPLMEAGDLLNEDFSAGFGSLVPSEDVERFEGVVTLAADGSLSSKHGVDGDVAIEIRLAEALGTAALEVGFGGDALTLRVGPVVVGEEDSWGVQIRGSIVGAGADSSVAIGTAQPAESIRVRNRSQALEVWFDGVLIWDQLLKAPVPGGTMTISAAVSPVKLESIRVERLGWFDGVAVEGLGEDRMSAARLLDAAAFRMLDPQPSRIDPEYKFTWLNADGSAVDPVTVRYAGIRPEEDDSIPMLTQALALAGIRPHLDIKVWDGEGPDDELPLTAGDDGTYRLDKGPGLIEAATLTWMGDVWPAATAWDVTNDRLLDRCVPAGPARRSLWTHIPDDCDEVKITLAGPGTPTVEQVIRIAR